VIINQGIPANFGGSSENEGPATSAAGPSGEWNWVKLNIEGKITIGFYQVEFQDLDHYSHKP
jgi:hypothetical protein